MVSHQENDLVPSTVAGRNWETNAAFWIRIIRERRDRYRTELTDDAVLNAIGSAEGRRILDAGCGEGYMSRLLAHRGASVVGIDSCQGLIHAARDLNATEGLSISYEVGDVGALPLADAIFDIILCNHLINDLPDPAIPFQEFARVLKPRGRLVILMLHPCFYISRSTEQRSNGGLISSEYFRVRRIEQHFEVGGITSPTTVVAWIRSLESYCELLFDAGFTITGLQEPRPTEQLLQDPWWRVSFSQPRFLLITAERR
jgi:2-polyprenyl-3-methyl-5-hydroxy-6-metoxy-1,4-benzoquinol methylase